MMAAMAVAVRVARRQPAGMLAAFLVAGCALAALSAPELVRDPLAQDIPRRLMPPGSDFPLGSDGLGRDLLSRLVHGARATLGISLASMSIALAVGAGLGVAVAYAGGRVDLLTQRVVDALLGFPPLVIGLLVVSARGQSVESVTLAFAFAFAPQFSRLARAQALAAKGEEFVLAARAMGASPLRVALRHILPHCLAPVLTLATGLMGTASIAEAALSYLGMGVPPPTASWGGILQDGSRRYLETAPWLTFFPCLALAALALSFSLLGDAVRDLLDPRLRHAGPVQAPASGAP